MPTTVKSERVLELALVNDHYATFVQPNEEGPGYATTLTIASDSFADFGRPEKITLTIQPNDLLNP